MMRERSLHGFVLSINPFPQAVDADFNYLLLKSFLWFSFYYHTNIIAISKVNIYHSKYHPFNVDTVISLQVVNNTPIVQPKQAFFLGSHLLMMIYTTIYKLVHDMSNTNFTKTVKRVKFYYF